MSLEAERSLIFSKLPTGGILPTSPYLAFIEQAFNDLSAGLYNEGYTPKLHELMQEITRNLIAYWKDVFDCLGQTTTERSIHGDEYGSIKRGNKGLSFGNLIGKVDEGRDSLEVDIEFESEAVYEDGSKSTDTKDESQGQATGPVFAEVENKRTREYYHEKHSFFVEIMHDTGEFIRPPSIGTQVREIRDFKISDVSFELNLQPDGWLGIFKRTMSWDHQDNRYLTVTNTSKLEFEQLGDSPFRINTFEVH